MQGRAQAITHKVYLFNKNININNNTIKCYEGIVKRNSSQLTYNTNFVKYFQCKRNLSSSATLSKFLPKNNINNNTNNLKTISKYLPKRNNNNNNNNIKNNNINNIKNNNNNNNNIIINNNSNNNNSNNNINNIKNNNNNYNIKNNFNNINVATTDKDNNINNFEPIKLNGEKKEKKYLQIAGCDKEYYDILEEVAKEPLKKLQNKTIPEKIRLSNTESKLFLENYRNFRFLYRFIELNQLLPEGQSIYHFLFNIVCKNCIRELKSMIIIFFVKQHDEKALGEYYSFLVKEKALDQLSQAAWNNLICHLLKSKETLKDAIRLFKEIPTNILRFSTIELFFSKFVGYQLPTTLPNDFIELLQFVFNSLSICGSQIQNTDGFFTLSTIKTQQFLAENSNGDVSPIDPQAEDLQKDFLEFILELIHHNSNELMGFEHFPISNSVIDFLYEWAQKLQLSKTFNQILINLLILNSKEEPKMKEINYQKAFVLFHSLFPNFPIKNFTLLDYTNEEMITYCLRNYDSNFAIQMLIKLMEVSWFPKSSFITILAQKIYTDRQRGWEKTMKEFQWIVNRILDPDPVIYYYIFAACNSSHDAIVIYKILKTFPKREVTISIQSIQLIFQTMLIDKRLNYDNLLVLYRFIKFNTKINELEHKKINFQNFQLLSEVIFNFIAPHFSELFKYAWINRKKLSRSSILFLIDIAKEMEANLQNCTATDYFLLDLICKYLHYENDFIISKVSSLSKLGLKAPVYTEINDDNNNFNDNNDNNNNHENEYENSNQFNDDVIANFKHNNSNNNDGEIPHEWV